MVRNYVTIKKHIFTAGTEDDDGVKLNVVPTHKFYEFFILEGEAPRILVTDPFEKIELGESELIVKKMTKERIAELPPIPTPIMKKFLKGSEEYSQYHTRKGSQDLFYEISSGISDQTILDMNESEIDEIVRLSVCGGFKIDKKLFNLFKIDILEPTLGIILPIDYQPYNSHQLMFTGPKVGKTSISDRVGLNMSSASIAGLLGFSTADTTIQGTLKDSTTSVTLDEIQEETDENLWSKLFNVLENGRAEVHKGKMKVITETCSAIRFVGNPHYTSEDKKAVRNEMLSSFVQTLGTISYNHEAFGSRIGVILYDDKIKKAKWEARSKKDLKDSLTKMKAIRKLAAGNFTQLYFDEEILTWLNKGFPDTYIAKSLEMISRMKGFSPAAKTVEGHISGSKHARGTAFKMACVDNLSDILKNTVDKQDLLESADDYFEYVQKINLDSFNCISNLMVNESSAAAIIKMSESEPQYIQEILSKISEVSLATGKNTLSLEEVRPPNKSINFMKEKVKRLKSALSKYGIDVNKSGGEYVIEIESTDIAQLAVPKKETQVKL